MYSSYEQNVHGFLAPFSMSFYLNYLKIEFLIFLKYSSRFSDWYYDELEPFYTKSDINLTTKDGCFSGCF